MGFRNRVRHSIGEMGMEKMKRFTLIFIITFLACLIIQVVYDRNRVVITKYIKTQIQQAKLQALVVRYNLKPQGLEA